MGRIHRPAIWDSGDHSQDRAHLYDLKQMALQNVAYEIQQEGRLLHVRILVDAYWLQHHSTVYPITIDPQVELTESNLTTGGFSRGAKCTGAAASSIVSFPKNWAIQN